MFTLIHAQDDVRRAIELLESATELVNEQQLFGASEQIDEVATSDVKFLLLPAFLGFLTLKLTAVDRTDLMKLSRVYFKDYLTRLTTYGADSVPMEVDEPDDEEEMKENILMPSSTRRRNNRRRRTSPPSVEQSLSNMRDIIRSSSDEDMDEEFVRRYYLTLLTYWTSLAKEELNNIEVMLKRIGQDGSTITNRRPYIIYDQKPVFGTGYMSNSSMSADDFSPQPVVSEEDVDRIAETRWDYVNGHYHRDRWHEWTETLDEINPYDEQLFHVLPYVHIGYGGVDQPPPEQPPDGD